MAAKIRNPGRNKFSQLSQLRTSDLARPAAVRQSPPSSFLCTLRDANRHTAIRASSPQSCITDAFSGDTSLWPPVGSDYGRVGAWVHDRPDTHPWSVSSCVTETETLNDCFSSSTTTTHRTMATASAMSSGDGGGGDKIVVVVGHDCSHEDSGKEVAYSPVLPLVHCRIDSVLAPHGFPEFMPDDDDDEPEDPDNRIARQHRFCRTARAREHPLCPAPAPAPMPAEEAVPEHKPLLDAMTISRQLMAQEWTETPPMRLDMAKLAMDNEQRLPWLMPPVSANERPRKWSRSPLRWRFW